MDNNCVTCCGTGTGNFPIPGDPDISTSILRAVAVYGGVEVSWTYPSILPEAVAHTYVYRGYSTNYNEATEIALVSGNTFFDLIGDSKKLYYWIRMVSVHGTQGNLIGPAECQSRSRIADTISDLSNQINEGMLSQAIKSKMDAIDITYRNLQTEIRDRLNSNTALGNSLNNLSKDVNNAFGLIDSEITARMDGMNGLIDKYDILAVANSNNAAAIINETKLRVDADSAMASSLSIIQAKTASNTSAISTETTVRSNQYSSLASRIDTISSSSGAAITAAIQEEKKTFADPTKSIAESVSTIQAQLNGQIATVRTDATSAINTITGRIDTIYTVKLQAGDLIGGFGLMNDGKTIEAGFDVNRFWVGSNTVKIKPFIINGSNTYIQNAMIQNAAIDTAKIGDLAVTNAKIGDLAVGTAKIADAAITNAKIANLAVKNANIEDASINNAKIANLSVSTIKIGDNAVTIPVAATAPGTVRGNGGTQYVVSVLVTLDAPGMIYATSSGYISYGTGWTPVEIKLLVNGSVYAVAVSNEGLVTANMAASAPAGAGQYTISLIFTASDKAAINYATLFAMGVKK